MQVFFEFFCGIQGFGLCYKGRIRHKDLENGEPQI